MSAERGRYEPIARRDAHENGVPEELFVRLISQESNWDPQAISPAGAIGIAQLIPRYHPSVNAHDPVASLEYAAGWLSKLRGLYGSWQHALIAWNWGPGNFTRWDHRPETLPDETRTLLNVVLGPGWPEPGGAAAPPSAGPAYCFPVQDYPRGKIPLHWGVSANAADLFAPRGTPVRAMVDGSIADASWDNIGGWSVYLVGTPATKSLHYYMAHMRDEPPVSTGQRVTAGQTIGLVGDTGNAAAAGPHLHIGIGTSIKEGTGPEGGAGVPWPGNNCNKYLQHVLDVLGSGPVQPGQPAPPPPETPEQQIARLTAERDQARADWRAAQVAIAHLNDKVVKPAYLESKRIREEFVGPEPG